MNRDCHPECDLPTAKYVAVLLIAIGMGVLCGYLVGTKEMRQAVPNDPPLKVRGQK